MAAKNQLVFFDTNLLVYQFDRRNREKQQVAERLISRAIAADQAVISSQVMQEFINVALRKFDTQIPAYELKLVMQDLLEPICAHVPSAAYYYRAVDLYSFKSLSFYDALIIQAALDLGCQTLYSEDMQKLERFGNLTIVNPFV